MFSALLISAISPAWAAQLVLEADTRQLKEGQVVALHLTVVDATPKGPPQIPDVRGLQFGYQGQRHSTVMVNFKTTRTVTYTYSMAAMKPGRWEVGPVEMALDGQALKSNSLTVEVAARDTLATGEGVSATLGSEEAWVGQTLVYHLEFSTPKQVADLRWTPPEFEGFVPEQTAESTQKEYDLVEEGVHHTVVELDMPLVATSPGARDIPPAVLQAQHRVRRPGRRRSPLDSLYQTENEIYTTGNIPVAVRPLPAAGRSERWSGLVGDFRVRAELSDERVAVGESATLTVTVEGDGTLSGFSLPEMGADGFRAYDDQAEITGEVAGGRFRGVGTFRRAIVPEAPGEITVPPLRLQIFSPSAGNYMDLSTQPIRLVVTEGEESQAVTSYTGGQVDTRQHVADLADDILPIHARPKLGSQIFNPVSPAVLAPVGLPLLALVGLGLRDVAASRGGREDRRKLLRARLKTAKDAGELEGVLREALGIALGCPAGAVDRARIEAGLEDALKEEALAIYGDLEEARYGGGAIDEGLAARVIALANKLLGAK